MKRTLLIIFYIFLCFFIITQSCVTSSNFEKNNNKVIRVALVDAAWPTFDSGSKVKDALDKYTWTVNDQQ